MVVHGCAWINLCHAMMVDECDQSVLHRGQLRGALFTIINLFHNGCTSNCLVYDVKLEKKRRKERQASHGTDR